MTTPLTLLLIEDNDGDAEIIQRKLREAENIQAIVLHVRSLKNGLIYLMNKNVDAVLVDLTLPDSHGIDTVVAVQKNIPQECPIVVLSGREDIETAIQTVQVGAQAYIIKQPDMSSATIEREILFAIERARDASLARKLIQRSVEKLSFDMDPGSTPPDLNAAMSSEHLRTIDSAVEKIRNHLFRNSPQHSQVAEEILRTAGFFTAMRELGHLYNNNKHAVRPKRTQTVSQRAIQAIQKISANTVSTDPYRDLYEVVNRDRTRK